MSEALVIHKIGTYKTKKTEEREATKRVYLTLSNSVNIAGFVAAGDKYGNVILALGTKLADVQAKLSLGDVVPNVQFGEQDDEGFYRVVPA